MRYDLYNMRAYIVHCLSRELTSLCAQIGRINLLTPEVIRAAQESELKDGKVVSLKYGVIRADCPFFLPLFSCCCFTLTFSVIETM